MVVAIGGFGSALEFGRGPGSLFIPSTVQCHLTESETLSVGFSKELQPVDYVAREMPRPHPRFPCTAENVLKGMAQYLECTLRRAINRHVTC